MHANVWEWCSDWYDADYYKSSPVDDPTGPTKGTAYVHRGGYSSFSAANSRSAHRGGWRAAFSRGGFRVVMVLATPDSP
jgi:formylglycine-generating enzyme required for sulfatase activity